MLVKNKFLNRKLLGKVQNACYFPLLLIILQMAFTVGSYLGETRKKQGRNLGDIRDVPGMCSGCPLPSAEINSLLNYLESIILQAKKDPMNIKFIGSFLCFVEVTGLEPATAWSQTRNATNCATPRCFI